MKLLTLSLLNLLQLSYESEVPAYAAAQLSMSLLEDQELKAELAECREQAYAGLNADIGDYVKQVQILVHTKIGVAQKRALEKQLADLEAEILALSN